MAKLTKRRRIANEKIDKTRRYPLEEAVTFLNDLAKTSKFRESLDVAINLGIDPRRSDQIVRGATTLPHSIGKEIRVAVFADGDQVNAAEEAGADIVGLEDLAEQVKKGNLDFDVVLATPDSMKVLGPLGRILGPRGLMPNVKTGTVTNDMSVAVKNAKSGQVQFRADRGGVIHGCIGQVGQDPQVVKANVSALLEDLRRARPAASKGTYFKKITLSSTMGPGIMIEEPSISS